MATVIIARGNASISINEQETEAHLVFVPNPDGEGWDLAAINKLAGEKQLSAYPDQKALETFLSKAAKAKTSDPLEMVFVKGVDPEPASAEKINWEVLPVPGDMVPFQKEAVDNAGEPEIIRLKVEKVKLEKIVRKAGALPFMAGKEELAVCWEKKETREKVMVNPEPKEIKYAKKGAKIGTITPPSPGKPGKSILGRIIPPRPPEDGSCLFGKGIHRNNLDLFAGYSGFLRIGENWADIVPSSRPSYSINTGSDGLTLFFNFEPGDARFALPAGEEILNAAVDKGAAKEVLISAWELDEAIKIAAKNHEPIEAFSLFRSQEAEARVVINEDKTRAALFLRKGIAGARPLEMKDISQAIKESGVRGFDLEQLKVTILDFMKGTELVLSDHVLVEGSPSTRGTDKIVNAELSLLSEEEKKLVIARLKSWKSRDVSVGVEFDPERVMSFAFVEEGDIIASISDGSAAEDGKDIFGNIIPGLPGNDPDIKLFRGLKLQGSKIIASKNGLLLLEISENSFHGDVIDYQDAKIGIHISDDLMLVKGDLFREEGAGIPLTIGNIRKLLLAMGITKGINWEEIEKACLHARIHGNALGIIAARGAAPIAWGGSAMKWHVPLDPLNQQEPGGNIQIKAGNPIVDISSPLPEGRPGYDVKGTEIPSNNAIKISIEHDESIKALSFEKGRRLVAARSGELEFDGTNLKITFEKTIEGDVGAGTGDIKFSGDIKISGNVLPGCKVIGDSHIIVEGFADQALISAGGKAVAAMGIKGGGKGIVRARAGIESAYAERASVMAVGDIKLDKGSVFSAIKTNGKLLITDENGKLAGGICQARHGIDAANIGSEKGVRTEISFGQDYLVKDEIRASEEQAEKIRGKLSGVEEEIKAYLGKKLPLSDEIRNEKIRLMKFLEQLNLKIFSLTEKFEEHFESEIRIRGTVFPGVVIESHGRYYQVNHKRSQVVFYFDRESGRIKETSLS